MKIRQLAPGERFAADMISHVAFHMKTEDPEELRKKSEQATVEDWGAFDDDGQLMARIINNRYESQMDGNWILNGGIGAVSTLPEYRNSGAVRAVFSQLLPSAYRSGEIISTLYPFSHAFYRKFGYETVCPVNVYTFSPGDLAEYRFEGKAVQWKPGCPVSDYLALYHRFAAGYNLAVRRTEESLVKTHFQGLYYRDRKFAYLLYEDSLPVAYLIFQDVRNDPAAILRVEDLAWTGRSGFLAILGFLSRFSADYGRIELPLPVRLELLSLIHCPQAYHIQKETHQNYMIRVINAQRLLASIHKPPECRFVIRVADEMIPENNGTWAVSHENVLKTEDSPDLSVSIRALGQMAVGSISLEEAEYREDVEVFNRRPVLEKVFVRKSIFLEDHF